MKQPCVYILASGWNGTIYVGVTSEKAIKEGRRSWKIELIEATNSKWRDLYPALV